MTAADRIASARLKKAMALAAVLREVGIAADEVAALSEEVRANAEAVVRALNPNPPRHPRPASDATWLAVADVLRRTCEHGYFLVVPGSPCPPFHAAWPRAHCPTCGAFVRRSPQGTCTRCRTEWDNGDALALPDIAARVGALPATG